MPDAPDTSRSDDPLVYVILVNWNGKDVTRECILSLRKVTYPQCKVIVVDNASTDGSVELIREEFPEVTLLPQTENLRFAGGNNVGMRHALESGAEYILLLNNDTTVHPDFLSHLVGTLKKTPQGGMATPKIYYYDNPRRIWFAGGEISFWTGTMKHLGIRQLDSGQNNTFRETGYATGCCVLLPRKVVEEVGMLDESYFMYTEDADWSMRVRRAGYTIMYDPASHVWHKLSVSAGGHLSAFKMKSKFFSNMRFFARYASWYHWFVFPWANIVVNSYAAFRYFIGR